MEAAVETPPDEQNSVPPQVMFDPSSAAAEAASPLPRPQCKEEARKCILAIQARLRKFRTKVNGMSLSKTRIKSSTEAKCFRAWALGAADGLKYLRNLPERLVATYLPGQKSKIEPMEITRFNIPVIVRN